MLEMDEAVAAIFAGPGPIEAAAPRIQQALFPLPGFEDNKWEKIRARRQRRRHNPVRRREASPEARRRRRRGGGEEEEEEEKEEERARQRQDGEAPDEQPDDLSPEMLRRQRRRIIGDDDEEEEQEQEQPPREEEGDFHDMVDDAAGDHDLEEFPDSSDEREDSLGPRNGSQFCFLCGSLASDPRDVLRKTLVEMLQKASEVDVDYLISSIAEFYRMHIQSETGEAWPEEAVRTHLRNHEVNEVYIFQEEIVQLNTLEDIILQSTVIQEHTEKGLQQTIQDKRLRQLLAVWRQRERSLANLFRCNKKKVRNK